jgi:hypothetical protein
MSIVRRKRGSFLLRERDIKMLRLIQHAGVERVRIRGLRLLRDPF